MAEKRKTKAEAKGPAPKTRQRKLSSDNEATTANETTVQSSISDSKAQSSSKSVEDDGLIRHRKPNKDERKAAKLQEKADKEKEKGELAAKYDVNQEASDDSSDEEVLIRTGNVPEHWYDLYDHKGYSVKGETVAKLPEQDELEKFVER